jgi:hypothetical protein
LTGTIRRNRQYLPKALLEKLNIGQKKFFRRGPILAAAYREKKSQKGPVLLQSTHSSTDNRSKTKIIRKQPKHTEKSEAI